MATLLVYLATPFVKDKILEFGTYSKCDILYPLFVDMLHLVTPIQMDETFIFEFDTKPI